MSAAASGLLLEQDLIFMSRITGTARDLGVDVRTCRSVDDLLAAAEKERPTCVLLDLHHQGLDIVDFIARLKSLGPIYTVGYGSHVDAATLKQARAAGCDLVLPRSKFVTDLPVELPKWLQGPR
jgi:CheY-like chemotaxis protein